MVVEMKKDLEAAAALEEKLRKADKEAADLKNEQEKLEQEKVQLAMAAASQQRQNEAEVSRMYRS